MFDPQINFPQASTDFDSSVHRPRITEALTGCLLGTAAGDSVGLPFEGLSKRATLKLLKLPLEQSLIAGKGLVSDDTEHTVIVALALIAAHGNVTKFQNGLAAKLRWWLLSIPPGVGSATARSIAKLWLGFSPSRSGVYSAGNGPAMRASLLGVLFGGNPSQLREFVRASTCVTHTDPKAFEAALAVAVAAHCAVTYRVQGPRNLFVRFGAQYKATTLNPAVLGGTLDAMQEGLNFGLSVSEFAAKIGCERGVSGYSLHTVPVAIYAALQHAYDFRAAVTSVVACGGDTDSTAAITGGIVGAGLGKRGIPSSWLDGILEWPRNVSWMTNLAERLADGLLSPTPLQVGRLEPLWLPWFFCRNVAMFAVVVYVYFRRGIKALLPSPTKASNS